MKTYKLLSHNSRIAVSGNGWYYLMVPSTQPGVKYWHVKHSRNPQVCEAHHQNLVSKGLLK